MRVLKANRELFARVLRRNIVTKAHEAMGLMDAKVLSGPPTRARYASRRFSGILA
jgi:hypothetical protein